MGLIRPHSLVAGDPLDYRRLKEDFLWAGLRVNDIVERAIANARFGRVNFSDASFLQMWYKDDPNVYQVFPHNPALVSGTDIPIRNDDSFVFGELTWSLEVESDSDSSILITAWPIFDSKSLWEGQDWAIYGNQFEYAGTPITDPDDDAIAGPGIADGESVTLGGTCNFVGLNGSMLSGVMVFSIGKWIVTKSQMQIKTRDR